ncbi:hypothetical protein CFC21_046901 [Triticum aestivum]|uniref:Uncharacterized protein n=2 Tax=Triticum aestivum TaxID=4565 RepID=A0A3B6GRU1_WHEAT|nr:hypothetical protein CFC21_046901 [Triticum aestivum]
MRLGLTGRSPTVRWQASQLPLGDAGLGQPSVHVDNGIDLNMESGGGGGDDRHGMLGIDLNVDLDGVDAGVDAENVEGNDTEHPAPAGMHACTGSCIHVCYALWIMHACTDRIHAYCFMDSRSCMLVLVHAYMCAGSWILVHECL